MFDSPDDFSTSAEHVEVTRSFLVDSVSPKKGDVKNERSKNERYIPNISDAF